MRWDPSPPVGMKIPHPKGEVLHAPSLEVAKEAEMCQRGALPGGPPVAGIFLLLTGAAVQIEGTRHAAPVIVAQGVGLKVGEGSQMGMH